MLCPECGKDYAPIRWDQGYCTVACGKLGANRELARARRVYRALYYRGFSPADLADAAALGEDEAFLASEIASWHREDREQGRGPPPPHNHIFERGHQRRRKAG